MGSPHNSHRSSAPDCTVRNSNSGTLQSWVGPRSARHSKPSLLLAAVVAMTNLPGPAFGTPDKQQVRSQSVDVPVCRAASRQHPENEEEPQRCAMRRRAALSAQDGCLSNRMHSLLTEYFEFSP